MCIFSAANTYLLMRITLSTTLCWLFLCFLPAIAGAQDDLPVVFQDRDYTLMGTVKTVDGQVLSDATIWVEEIKKGFSADGNGFFSFPLKAGRYTLKVSYIGYNTTEVPVVLRQNTTLLIKLEESLELLNTVEIVGGGADRNVKTTDIGVSRLGAQAIRELPTLLGEADVIRTIQTLPGVTSVGESATGFNVRGGNIDQNLLLLEDIPIFNPSHLIGFFSIFNPDMLRDMTFYRGGIPAQYGGRASSVLDVRLKDPARDQLHMRGSLGLITSRLMIEAPVIKDKLSVAIGSRVSYADYLFRWFLRPELKETEANFYDVTAKAVYRPSENDQVSFTAFTGKDAFRIAGDSLSSLEINATSTRYRWINSGMSAKWNHFFSPSTGASLTLVESNYRPTFDIPNPGASANFAADVNQRNIQLEGFKTTDKYEIRVGAQANRYRIEPGTLLPSDPLSAINPLELPTEKALETAGYLNADYDLLKWLRLSAGLRYSFFNNYGPGAVNAYAEGVPRDPVTVTGSTSFGQGESIQTYNGLEPRLGLRVGMGKNGSLKIGYHRAYQYLHLISNTTSALPTDRWKVSDPFIKPQVAEQISVGLFRNFSNNRWETSIEGYYKTIDNMPDFRSGVNLLLLELPETAILQGEGRAYGIEVLIRKKGTRLDGTLSYAISRSEILINSPYPEDRVFTGTYYPTNYNRPHTLNINVLYRFNRRIKLSAVFTYLSGRPTTFPEERINVGNIFIPLYSQRNGNTTPDYHRLDLGLIIDPDPRVEKAWKGRWNFSLYNVYARRNPYSVFFKTINDRPVSTRNRSNAYQLSVIGSIVPSISYEFEF